MIGSLPRHRRHTRNPEQMLREMMRWRTPDKEVLALSLLTAGEGFHSFSSFLPSFFTIRTLAVAPDSTGTSQAQKISNLRSGYVPAVAFALGMGTVVSLIAEHPLPLMTTAAASVLMVAAYESALPANVRFQSTALPTSGSVPMQGALMTNAPSQGVQGW